MIPTHWTEFHIKLCTLDMIQKTWSVPYLIYLAGGGCCFMVVEPCYAAPHHHETQPPSLIPFFRIILK